MVFDASSKTPGGESLNNLLAKGMNLLPKLFDILIKFRRYNFAFTADIKSAYNNILIPPHQYKYQKYLWKEGEDEISLGEQMGLAHEEAQPWAT